ncbi:MbnP family copper-binding protein [Agitococcus lubricus]|uniref:Methanobactin biosynthesis cassette protein MbnP n=1 Tax=Agitococcus lubricus TaxID=1077255 RepID=A0A2T5IZE0_9GAMM|nr:MbnP family copper-binding protein [Agitococcus lubricus]PTQ89384.1 methanobactin biosynthesis cassette protein MbnP [Agitococcus lubricus]
MRYTAIAALSVFTLALTGCGGGSDDVAVNAKQNITIQFAAQANGADVKCGAVNRINNLGASSQTAQLQDLRFYIADIKLINSQGQLKTVSLNKNNYQNYGVALLDFEDATGACENNATGTAGTNTAVVGEVEAGTYTGIQFLLGVPDTGVDSTGKTIALSHSDVMTAQAPLDIMSMGWSWQLGRRFVKIELQPDGQVTDTETSSKSPTWFLHLGATDCVDAPDTPALYSCSKPNLNTISLNSFNPSTQKVALDLTALFANTDIAVNKKTTMGCMSETNDTDCPEIFNAMGIDLATGKKSTTHTQTMFKVINK